MSKYTPVRLTAEQRQEQILQAGMKLASEGNLYIMSIRNIADACDPKCSPPTVKGYFKSLTMLRNKVIEKAIQDEDLSIIAQAITAVDPAVKDCHPTLKNLALEWCKNA